MRSRTQYRELKAVISYVIRRYESWYNIIWTIGQVFAIIALGGVMNNKFESQIIFPVYLEIQWGYWCYTSLRVCNEFLINLHDGGTRGEEWWRYHVPQGRAYRDKHGWSQIFKKICWKGKNPESSLTHHSRKVALGTLVLCYNWGLEDTEIQQKFKKTAKRSWWGEEKLCEKHP